MAHASQGKHSIGVLYYLLARMVLQMRGSVSQSQPWDVMVDLFFYREPDEPKEEEGEQDKFQPEPPTYGGGGGFAAPPGKSLVPAIHQILLFLLVLQPSRHDSLMSGVCSAF